MGLLTTAHDSSVTPSLDSAQNTGGSAYIDVDELVALTERPELSTRLRILDVTVAREYTAEKRLIVRSGHAQYIADGHLPGAAYLDLPRSGSDPDAPFPFTRPAPEALSRELQSLGIDDRTLVIVYDRDNGAWASRLAWILIAYGFDRVRVLRGGLGAWTAAGRVLSRGAEPRIRESASGPALAEAGTHFVDTEEVVRSLADPARTRLINTLRPEVFSGAEQPYDRPGHIPGSINLPLNDIIDNQAPYIDPLTARQRLETALEAVRPPGSPTEASEQSNGAVDSSLQTPRLIAYCGSGVNAAGYALALREAGIRNVAVYDGSMTAWSHDPELPLEVGGDSHREPLSSTTRDPEPDKRPRPGPSPRAVLHHISEPPQDSTPRQNEEYQNDQHD